MSSILFGGFLAVIPIIVHMMNRQKITPVAWGAMQFLLKTPVTVRRRRRVDNLLLMLIRMAILGLLALLLARPFLQGQGAAYSSTTPVDVAIVIDHSLSMGRHGQDASENLFDQAIKRSQDIAAMLPPTASVSIVLAEHSPRVITALPIGLSPANRTEDGKPNGEWAQTLVQLHQLKPGMTDANIPQAVQAATELLARGHNVQKMILILSDDQRSNWSAGSESAWRLALGESHNAHTMPVFDLPVSLAGSSAANVSLGALSIPDFLAINRPAPIGVTVTNTGGATMTNINVDLMVDGNRSGSQQVASLAAGQSQTLEFDTYFTQAGSHWLRVKTDILDGLDADNSATAAVNVSPKLPILIIDGALTSGVGFPATDYLLAAMQPVDPSIDPTTLILPKIISVAEAAGARLDDYPIVILNDVPRLDAGTIAKLADYTQRGNGLWIILGPRTQPDFLSGPLANSQLFPASSRGISAPTKPATIDVKDPDNATISQIAAAERNALAGTVVQKWWSLTPTSAAMHTILALTNPDTTGGAGQDPLVTEMDVGKNGGRVIVWTSSIDGHLDPRWNTLPTAMNFLPLVNETLFHLASSQSKSQMRQLNAGEALLWSGPATPQIESATLAAPDGVGRALPMQLRGDRYYTGYKDTFTPGLYELRFAPNTIPQPVYYSVNIDPRELDPALLAAPDIDWYKQHDFLQDRLSMETLPTALHAQRGGYDLWWLLAIFVMGLLLVEIFMTWLHVIKQAEVQPEKAGMISAQSHAVGGSAT